MADQPCRCHRSFAYVVPRHSGHCCFFPESQTCHPDEVAEWEREQGRRLTSARLAPWVRTKCSTTAPGVVRLTEGEETDRGD